MENYDQKYLAEADLVLLGTWTMGLFFIAQHPDAKWNKLVDKLPQMKDKRTALFTTYKLLTGSMFRKMKSSLGDKTKDCDTFLRSRSMEVTEANKALLEKFIDG